MESDLQYSSLINNPSLFNQIVTITAYNQSLIINNPRSSLIELRIEVVSRLVRIIHMIWKKSYEMGQLSSGNQSRNQNGNTDLGGAVVGNGHGDGKDSDGTDDNVNGNENSENYIINLISKGANHELLVVLSRIVYSSSIKLFEEYGKFLREVRILNKYKGYLFNESLERNRREMSGSEKCLLHLTATGSSKAACCSPR